MSNLADTSAPASSMSQARLPLTLIVAATSSRGIGLKGQLPWHIKADLQYFARVTSRTSSEHPPTSPSTPSAAAATPSTPSRAHNAVIMGRKTWDSIPPRFRPLRNRINVVISRSPPPPPATHGDASWRTDPVWADSLSSAIDLLRPFVPVSGAAGPAAAAAATERAGDLPPIERVFVIGGAQIYAAAEALTGQDGAAAACVQSVLLTHVFGAWETDTRLATDYEGGGDDGVAVDGQQRRTERWRRASTRELVAFTGEETAAVEGRRKEGDVEFEFRLYTRC